MKQQVRSYGIMAVACAIYALGFTLFYVPNAVAAGGVTGIAQILHKIFPQISIGVYTILVNAPLFALAWKLYGKKMLFGSIFCMLLSSMMIDAVMMTWTMPALPWGLAGALVGAVIGGLLLGVGMGMICKEGASVGGMDTGARILHAYFPKISMGKCLAYSNVVVVCAVALVFRQASSALLGVVGIHAYGKVMDFMLRNMQTLPETSAPQQDA